jgi:hypothetical protein
MPDIFIAEPKAEPKNEEPAPSGKESVLEEKAKSKQRLFSDEDSLLKSKTAVHLFSSFCKNPSGISFQTQEEGEKVLLFLRRDFITNAKWILTGIVLLILPLLLPFFQQFLKTILPSLPLKFYLIFFISYYLVVASYLYINFITWYFNVALITDHRVIDVDFSGLVYKDVATTKLSLVQDVSYAQVGVIRSFFDYGNILIQTAGSLDNFTFESAPKPEEAVHVIEELIGKRNE